MADHISLWRDYTSDPCPYDEAPWIVSKDGDSSYTVKVFEMDEYDQARAFAFQEALRRNLPAFEVDQFGNEEVIR